MQTKPTEAELDILNVLWQRGEATVRDVFEALSADKTVVYTTVLKTMQIMDEKGLVERDTQGKAHIYRAKLQKADAQRNFVTNMLDKLFGGSAKQLVLQALESKPASSEEMKEIREILERAEKEQNEKD